MPWILFQHVLFQWFTKDSKKDSYLFLALPVLNYFFNTVNTAYIGFRILSKISQVTEKIALNQCVCILNVLQYVTKYVLQSIIAIYNFDVFICFYYNSKFSSSCFLIECVPNNESKSHTKFSPDTKPASELFY